jgi:hypothetical protein
MSRAARNVTMQKCETLTLCKRHKEKTIKRETFDRLKNIVRKIGVKTTRSAEER